MSAGFICKLPPDLNNSRGVEKPHRPHTDWRNEQSIANPCWQRINHDLFPISVVYALKSFQTILLISIFRLN